MMEDLMKAIKVVWEKVKEVMNNLYTNFRKVCQYILSHVIISDRLSYNISKAFYSKKKRIRKKYMKRVFITN